MHSDPTQRAGNCREFIEDLIGRSTRRLELSDVEKKRDYWYLFFQDDDGEVRSGKGSMKAIRKSVQHGKLGEAAKVRASRSKAGPFEPLRKHPEFRDLVVLPPPAPDTPVATRRPTPTPKRLEADNIPHPPTPVTLCFVPPPDLGSSGPAPMIEFAQTASTPSTANTPDWFKWAAVFVIALVAGFGGYFIVPMVTRLRF